MKKVLLTGASGFVGRHCVPLLAASGYEVHAVSTREASVDEIIPHVFWHRANLLENRQVAQLVNEVQPTHLLHLAWCHTAPGKFWTDADNFRWVQASLTLLQKFAAYNGQRAVFAGTCAEYDWNYGYCCETHTPLRPTTLYGTCKHSLQLLSNAFGAHSGISVAWGRLFFLYGPGEYSGRLVTSVINSLLQGVPARCSSGTQIRDFMHIKDAASAFVALLGNDVDGPINVASGQPTAVKDVARKIGEILERRDLIQLGVLPARANEPPLLVADVRRLQTEVSWSARYDLDEGLRQTIGWWQAHNSACEIKRNKT